MPKKKTRKRIQKKVQKKTRKRKAASPVKTISRREMGFSEAKTIGKSYPAYRRLASALYAANYTADVDTVVLKSAFYLVLPMRVWMDKQEHYAPCEVIKIFIKEK